MSSILKALRKLEEEKAATREGGIDIGRDILRVHSPSRPGLSRLLPTVIFGAVLLLGWGTYRLLAPTLLPPPVPPVAGSWTAPSASAPAVAVAPSSPRLQPSIAAEPSVVEKQIEEREPASFPASNRQSPPSAAVSPLPIQPVQTPPPPNPVPAATIAQAPPGLTLTAIAYHDDPEARLAVINDLPVMIGTLVEDAVVEEILRDRVRLTAAGKHFEILLQEAD